VPEPQPDDAVNVTTPAGGWDSSPIAAARAAINKRAAR
jgi:localization factor PodJL